MKLALNIAGIQREIASRGGAGFYEGRVFFRIEEERQHVARAQVFLRVTAMAKAAEGGLFLCEVLEHVGQDVSADMDGTNEAGRLIALLKEACEKYGVQLLEGRIELI